jgi:UDP-N-acetylmuramoyl-tripeptide--D-alanyl-D-alanine ligase
VTVADWSLPIGVLNASRFDHGLAWVTVGSCMAACAPAGVRWLRVAQREHYLAGSVGRFAVRWWRSMPANGLMAVAAVAAAVVSLRWPIAGVATAAAVAAGPLGLSLHGRTSPLAWTRRLWRLAATWAVLEVALVAIGVVTGLAAPLAVVAVLAVPVVVDLACGITFPLERRLSVHYVDEAAARLERVDPVVVAVTGSFGKTSTKNHIAHLVGGARAGVATPASFNNRAGLARAVNEQLADGTEVFVAEMGTYGRGEIADLCRWCPPDIAVITAIGPVHLERFGSEERIVEAKAEIIESAADVVLPVDDPRLAALADRAARDGKRVLRCSDTDRSADVCVARGDDRSGVSVFAHGSLLADDLEIPTGVQPTNLAVAVAVALVLEVDPATIGARLRDLPPVDHRLAVVHSSSGMTILDDTYNSNPTGASAALRALVPTSGGACASEPSAPHRLVVVTPGMVELGSRQFEENREFGAAVANLANDLVIVGRTNRRALEAGARAVAQTGARVTRVTRVRDRLQAVDWVREHLGPGDAVLYENDLPDHYP